MMFDSGATVSLIKVRNLKGETKIKRKKITLIGITGHKAHTIGMMQATINLKNQKITHNIYVVRDDFPMEYEGILGIEFLRQHQVSCNYRNKEIKIGESIFKLTPYNKIILKPRSKTIVQAVTNRNETGIIQVEETAPGVYIGRCLVEPKNLLCPVSVINTTDETVEIRTPRVIIEDVNRNDTHNICTIAAELNHKHSLPRKKQI